MRLSHRNYDAILERLPELYARRPLDELLAVTLRLVDELVPGTNATWMRCVIDGPPRLVTWIEREPECPASLLPRIEAGIPSHPFAAAASAAPVVRLSDCPRRALEQHRYEFSDVYEHVTTKYAMGTVFGEGPDRIAGLTITRDTRDFSALEMGIVTALAPHIRRAYLNCLTWDAMSSSIDRACRVLEARSGLSPREALVAIWVAEAKTNAEIAAILNISRRTVDKHVERILAKLQLDNRVAAAVHIRRLVESGAEGSMRE